MTLNVFITGASSGLGEALALEYAAQGASLCLVARRADVLHALRVRLATVDNAGAVEVHVADVTDTVAMAGVASDFIARHGAPDIVIACAGISLPVDVQRGDQLAAFRQVMATNTFGTIATFQPFVAAMKARGSGKLVGIASVAGVRGLPGASAYSASKAAVITLCESLRVELRGTGVEVLTLCPGYVRTPMTAKVPYKQPFLMAPEAFARKAVATIASGKSYAVIPWQMGWMAKLLKLLPNAIYDPMMKKARTPRVPVRR